MASSDVFRSCTTKAPPKSLQPPSHLRHWLWERENGSSILLIPPSPHLPPIVCSTVVVCKKKASPGPYNTTTFSSPLLRESEAPPMGFSTSLGGNHYFSRSCKFFGSCSSRPSVHCPNHRAGSVVPLEFGAQKVFERDRGLEILLLLLQSYILILYVVTQWKKVFYGSFIRM